jgi:NADPH-dependent glutamate synthase beta subunit-like oxidoreductase
MNYPVLAELALQPRHVVAICGGAVSGSEAAAVCAAQGITALVFEQNARPYGKIEDGLPRWHDKLRAKEFKAVDDNLARPGVYFVPKTRLGVDLSFDELVKEWGVSAVVLANGAWRDRPLPVPGAHDYAGKGLVYQNPLVYWFNHYEDPGYDGPQYRIADDAIVIGGGLASIDLVKIINLELYRSALRQRGIHVDVVEMEHAGITGTLQKHKVDPKSLGIAGATLYYRRRVRDMPIAFPWDSTPEQIARIEGVRETMIKLLEQRYRVRVKDCHVPVAPVVEGERLVGLTFHKSEIRDGKALEIPESRFDVRSDLIVSSIGSVPEFIQGIPTRGELYHFHSVETGALSGLPGVFGLGNVLTGRGNIKDSRANAKTISDRLLCEHIGLTNGHLPDALEGEHEAAQERAKELAARAVQRPMVPSGTMRNIATALARRWQAAGYDGDYASWIARHRAPG